MVRPSDAAGGRQEGEGRQGGRCGPEKRRGRDGMDSGEFLRFLAAMLAIMNPIGGMPVFISLTADRSPEERRRIALIGSLAVLVVLAVTALAGEPILHFFGISVPRFASRAASSCC